MLSSASLPPMSCNALEGAGQVSSRSCHQLPEGSGMTVGGWTHNLRALECSPCSVQLQLVLFSYFPRWCWESQIQLSRHISSSKIISTDLRVGGELKRSNLSLNAAGKRNISFILKWCIYKYSRARGTIPFISSPWCCLLQTVPTPLPPPAHMCSLGTDALVFFLPALTVVILTTKSYL